MKTLYKIVMFFLIFPFVVLAINSLGVFDNTFYSDAEFSELQSQDNAVSAFGYLFTPEGGYEIDLGFYKTTVNELDIGIIVSIFVVGGAAIGVFTHSWTPVVVLMIGVFMWSLIGKSQSFFNKLFFSWDVQALTYIGIMFGVVIVAFVFITIVEAPAQGRS